MTQIYVKDESSVYKLYVYERCKHYSTTIEVIDLPLERYDEQLRCNNCGLVLETLSELQSRVYDCE